MAAPLALERYSALVAALVPLLWNLGPTLRKALGRLTRGERRASTLVEVGGLLGTLVLGYVGLTWNGIPGYLRNEHRFPGIVSLVGATTLKAKNTAAPNTLYLTVTTVF